jgi:hypothetical protein
MSLWGPEGQTVAWSTAHAMYLWFYSPLLGLGRFFSFLIFFTVGRTPWTGDQLFARLLPAHGIAQTQNKRIQTSMPQVGFEPTIPVYERAKTVIMPETVWLPWSVPIMAATQSQAQANYKIPSENPFPCIFYLLNDKLHMVTYSYTEPQYDTPCAIS